MNDSPNKVNRFSCRCKLCKAKWTTEKSAGTTYTEHSVNCPSYTTVFKNYFGLRIEKYGESTERAEMASLWMVYRQIEGYVNNDVRCDARCGGATGPCCECSCGGENHGRGSLL